jgi:2-dehydropantoate 2-reductase
MNKVAIFGIGAIGSVLTKYLLENKHNQLSYFNRSFKSNVGIVFNNQLINLPIEKINQDEGPYDWIIICLKTYQIKKAKKTIKQLVGPKTKMAVFRNGLDLQNDFLVILPTSNILETIIDCPTQVNADGNYLQLKLPRIVLPTSSLAKEFKELFINSKIQIQFIESFKTAQWEKLIESSSMGALQVLTGKTCVIFKDPKMVDK